MALREIDDRLMLQEYLSRDPIGCAYQLGYLDDAYASWTRWWGVFDDESGELDLLLLLYTGLSVPLVATVGDGALLEQALVELYPDIPTHFYCQMEHDHVAGISNRFEVDRLQLSLRLALQREEYERVPDDPDVVRLGHQHVGQITRLFKHLPDTLFEPFLLDTGYFFGLWDRSGGRLASLSGVQVFSRQHEVAVLGPLITHPSVRRLGLAWRVLGRQLNELFEVVKVVVLNVPESNQVAQHTYLSHFFEPYRYFWEGMVRLKF